MPSLASWALRDASASRLWDCATSFSRLASAWCRLRGVAIESGLGLAQSFLIGTGVDLEQEIAFLDIGAFGKRDFDQFARDLRFDLDHGG